VTAKMSVSPVVKSKHPRRSVTDAGKSYRIVSDEEMRSGSDGEASGSGAVASQTSRRANGAKRKRVSADWPACKAANTE
jgi:hypothetical protein